MLSLKWYIYRDSAFLAKCVTPMDILGALIISCLLKNEVKEEVEKKVRLKHEKGNLAQCLLPMQNMLTFHCGTATHHMGSIYSRKGLVSSQQPAQK